MSRRVFVGSSGTYNVRASELAREKRVKAIRCTVFFLDDSQQTFELDVSYVYYLKCLNSLHILYLYDLYNEYLAYLAYLPNIQFRPNIKSTIRPWPNTTIRNVFIYTVKVFILTIYIHV